MSRASLPLAGVIGTPIAHSRSPRLHQHWLRRYGVVGHYIPMNVASSDLEDAIRTLPKLGFVGINVTIPHKEHVMTLADLVSDRAAVIGSVNTLIFRADGKVHGDNTDGFGFMENLRQGAGDWDPRAGPAAVIGAGGAARRLTWGPFLRKVIIGRRTSGYQMLVGALLGVTPGGGGCKQ